MADRGRVRLWLCAVAAVALVGACREPLALLSADTSLVENRSVAHAALTALSARVTLVSRDPKYDSARVKIARSAFIPSRVFSDTAVWSSITGVRRTLLISGRSIAGHYRLEAVRSLAPITQIAESRHTIRLTRLTNDEYSWDTDIQYALGWITADNAAMVLRSLLASAESRTESSLRAEYRTALPLTTATLGEVFSLDSVRTAALTDGSTLAFFSMRMSPDGIRQRYPHYADYLDRYAQTAKMHWSLNDRAGLAYLDLNFDAGRLSLRVRSRDGVLLALTGAARPMPDTVTFRGGMTVKVHYFTVGFHNYRGELTFTHAPHERAMSLVTRQEPSWDLPLITARLLRSPLRRPFAGNGSLYRMGVRDDTLGGQSVLTRRMHLEVQESAILRFIGRLSAIVVSDYDEDVEREGNRWLREVFVALSNDVAGELSHAGP